jgi:hypothetical protein
VEGLNMGLSKEENVWPVIIPMPLRMLTCSFEEGICSASIAIKRKRQEWPSSILLLLARKDVLPVIPLTQRNTRIF